MAGVEQFLSGGRMRLWSQTATSTSGVATFYPTTDGTGSGVALFTSIECCFVSGEANTGTFTSMPFAAIKAIAGDRKSVTANVGVGTVLGILGATVIAAPDGTVVHCLVMGT